MMWLADNLGTIAVGSVVFLMAWNALRSVKKDVQSGGCPGGCGGCTGCSHGSSCSCHSAAAEQKNMG